MDHTFRKDKNAFSKKGNASRCRDSFFGFYLFRVARLREVDLPGWLHKKVRCSYRYLLSNCSLSVGLAGWLRSWLGPPLLSPKPMSPPRIPTCVFRRPTPLPGSTMPNRGRTRHVFSWIPTGPSKPFSASEERSPMQPRKPLPNSPRKNRRRFCGLISPQRTESPTP